MSICFIWIPFGGFRVTQYITSIGLFYNEWEFTCSVSDCEELVAPSEEAYRQKLD